MGDENSFVARRLETDFDVSLQAREVSIAVFEVLARKPPVIGCGKGV